MSRGSALHITLTSVILNRRKRALLVSILGSIELCYMLSLRWKKLRLPEALHRLGNVVKSGKTVHSSRP